VPIKLERIKVFLGTSRASTRARFACAGPLDATRLVAPPVPHRRSERPRRPPELQGGFAVFRRGAASACVRGTGAKTGRDKGAALVLQSCTAQKTFAKLCCAIGIRTPVTGGRVGRGPRRQDLRHSFATRKLVEWYRAGIDVTQKMPTLSAYLGHVSVHSTYWYIQAIPELLQLATQHSVACARGDAS